MENSYRYFYTLVKLKHFTNASKELGITQSALSKSIKELEFKLNVTLLDRESKSFKLTKSGRIIYDYAVSLKQGKEIMMQRLLKTNKKPPLRIIAGTYWLEHVLTNIIPTLESKSYNTNIKIYSTNHRNISTEELFATNKIDLYLGPFEDFIHNKNDDLVKEHLDTIYHCFFAHKDHTIFNNGNEDNFIFNYPLITLGGVSRKNNYSNHNKFETDIENWKAMVIETSSIHSAINLVKNQGYIVLLPNIMKNEMAEYGIIPVYESATFLSFTSGAVYQKNDLTNPYVHALLDEIRKSQK